MITRIQIEHIHRVTKRFDPAEQKNDTSAVLDITEHLLLDRETHTVEYSRIQDSKNKVFCRYEMEEDVEILFHRIEDAYPFAFIEGSPDDVVEKPNETNLYTIIIDYDDGQHRIMEGYFGQLDLPDGYDDFADFVWSFICFHTKTELFNPKIYNKPRRCKSDLIFCSVEFESSYKSYYYLTDDDSIEIGDLVIVPVGANNQKKVVEVVNIEYFDEEHAPFPLEKIKRIIGKYGSDTPKVIYYDFDGDFDSEELLSIDTLRCHGMRARCKLRDGSLCTGFANLIYSFEKEDHTFSVHDTDRDYITLDFYPGIGEDVNVFDEHDTDLSQVQHTKIPVADILSLEVLRFSGYRSGKNTSHHFEILQ